MKGTKSNDRRFPLPRRTGHADFPHPALAKAVPSREHAQRLEAQVFQVSIKTNPCPCSPASLAASAQMSSQPLPHKPVDMAKRLARVAQLEIVRPAPQVAAHLFNQFGQGGVTLVRVDFPPQRLPFPFHRLSRGFQVPVALWPTMSVAVIPEGVAQKVQALARLSQIHNPGFLP